jgi:hypothetical protein
MDVQRFMEEGRVVVFNLAPQNRLSSQLANTIGALVLNEVLATARSLPRGVRYPTYLLLDEFQNFVGPDIEAALPEVRQLGLRLLLSHQSFSQLKRGDYDLTTMIFQAQSRLIFGVQGEDADILAHELASITFNPMRVKEEIWSRRQRVKGQRVVELSSWSDAEAQSEQWKRDYGENWSTNEGVSRTGYRSDHETKSRGSDSGHSERRGEGGGTTRTRTTGAHQTLVAEHEDFDELSNRSYFSFEEDVNVWAREIRNRPTGSAFLRLVDDPKLYDVDVKRSAPLYLAWDTKRLARDMKEVLDDVDRLVEENFRSELFVSPSVIEAETQQRLEAVLQPAITVEGNSIAVTGTQESAFSSMADSERFA